MSSKNIFITLLGVMALLGVNSVFAEDSANKSRCMKELEAEHYELALQYCESEADKGDINAAEKVGFLYLKGKAGVRDWDLARRYLEQSIDGGNLEANRYLGIIYWNGLGVEKNGTKAREFFKECTKVGPDDNIDCALEFAKVLSYNSNPATQKIEGVELYEQLVNNKHYEISYELASALLNTSQFADAYKYADFFVLWVRRYGDLSFYKRQVNDAERIKDEARKHLEDRKLTECFNWARHKIYEISNNLTEQAEQK